MVVSNRRHKTGSPDTFKTASTDKRILESSSQYAELKRFAAKSGDSSIFLPVSMVMNPLPFKRAEFANVGYVGYQPSQLWLSAGHKTDLGPICV